METLDVRICSSCGLVQQCTLPTDGALRVYYSHHYRTDYKKTYRPKNKHVFRAGIAAGNRLAFLESSISNGDKNSLKGLRHLDVGAGGGEVVFAAQALLGLESIGIEPNEGYSEFARITYGIEVRTAELSDVISERFDLVTMFHVLEHMPKPLQVFELLFSMINPDGLLLIEVPNIEQADASPHNIFFRAHLLYYSRATLLFAASRWFEPIRIDEQGNLRVLFKRRSTPEAPQQPSPSDVEKTLRRLSEKGWTEYIIKGGGWKRPYQRLLKYWKERQVAGLTPLETLRHAIGSQ
jgi:2-polyprenyl-3-methyl-5-hydroxy-6-metoxy-1,4-benzoquinol methylase